MIGFFKASWLSSWISRHGSWKCCPASNLKEYEDKKRHLGMNSLFRKVTSWIEMECAAGAVSRRKISRRRAVEVLENRTLLAGDLDLSFGTAGKVLTSVGTGSDQGTAMAVDSSSRIIVVGTVAVGGSDTDFGVVRYTSSGALDTSFGTGGKVITSFNTFFQYVYDVAVQADGKIVVAGSTYNGSNFDFGLARYNSNGTLDNTFDENGLQTINFGGDDTARAIAIQSDGKIVVVGETVVSGQAEVAIARLNPADGQLDLTFGSSGRVTTAISAQDDAAHDVAIQSDGKIIIVGRVSGGTYQSALLARYTASGALDATFDDNGLQALLAVPGDTLLNSVLIQPDGKIVASGRAYAAGGDFLTLRVNGSNGAFDTTFNGSGYVTTAIGNHDEATAILRQSDGSLVVTGTSHNGTSDHFAWARYTAAGVLDTTFAKTGYRQEDVEAGADIGRSAVMLSIGKFLVAGSSQSDAGSTDFALVRVETANTAPTNVTISSSSLNENLPSGTTVGTFQTTDFDNTSFTYSLVTGTGDTNNASFTIVGNELRTNAVFNYEAKSSYAIRLRTADTGGLTFDKQFTIAVNNLNEAPSNITLSNSSVAENAGANSVIGTLSATDQDTGESFTFSLPSGIGDNAAFNISGTSLQANASFDLETKSSYSVTVRVTDAGNLSFEKQFTVTVTDVDEIPPTVVSASFVVAGTVEANATSLTVTFSESVIGGTTTSNYELRREGADGLLGNVDDQVVAISSATISGNIATLNFAALPEDVYRLTIKDTITDAVGYALDGDGNGSAGGSAKRDFVANRVISNTPDPSFGGSGVLGTQFSSPDTNEAANGLAVQADGKIVVAGFSNNGSNNDFAVARYNSDGTLDTTFSGEGKTTTAIGSSSDIANSVAVQIDGKIVVAGYSFNGSNNDFALARYNSDGTLDTTFSGDGKLRTNASSADIANSIAVQDDGKIVVAGYSFNGSNYDFAILRYNGDGTLDTSFDGDGFLPIVFATSDDFATNLALQSDGKIVVCGYSLFGSDYDFAIARLNSNGTLDTSFSGDGKQLIDLRSQNLNDVANDVLIQSDGKIVVAGYSYSGIDDDFAIARFNSNGTLDTSFSGDGISYTGVGPSNDYATGVAMQSNGKIVVGGYSSNGGNNDFALTRYNSDGTLDLSFSGDGKQMIPLGPANDNSTSIAIQNDGNILVTGYVYNGSNNDFALLRLLNAESSVSLSTLGGRVFDIDLMQSGAGQLLQGPSGAFDGLNRMVVGASDFSPTGLSTLVDNQRTAQSAIASISGLEVQREVTVPAAGSQDFARTVDTFTNSTGSPITTSVRVVGNLGSDAATTVFATSDGDTIVESTDWWFGTDDTDGTGTPAIIHLIHGPRGLVPTSVNVIEDNIEWTYDLTVGAGETKRLASFTVLGTTRSAAIAAANTLVTTFGFGGQAAAFLTADEMSSLANFQFNHVPSNIALSSTSLAENSGANAVVGALSATDQDAGETFTFSLPSGVGDNAAFNISGTSLRANASLDFETKNSYSVTVSVTDAGGLRLDRAFTISITNVPEVPHAIHISNDHLPENEGPGIFVGTLTTTDPDSGGLDGDGGGVFTYSLAIGIGDTDNHSFQIDGDMLFSVAVFDYEADENHIIRVRTTDLDGLWFETNLIVWVTNVNEDPTNISLSNASVSENLPIGTVVGDFSTTDPDIANTFTYTLVTGTGSTDNASLTIDGSTLKTAAVFNFETTSSYSIRVRSTDQGGLTVESLVTINVTDVAEDVTAPVSLITALAATSNSLSIPILVTGSDPGAITTGVKEYDLYYSTGGAFVKFATVPLGSPSTTFTGSANTTYWFRSLGRDNAGNVETKTTSDTYARIGDVVPPVTQVTSAVPNAGGLFTVQMTGTKTSGTALTVFDVYVSIDSNTPVLIGSASGVSLGSGNYSGQILFQGALDGASHTYRFYSRGRDGAGNVEAAAVSGDVSVTYSFASAGLVATAIDVQNGIRQRSYVRYLDVLFSSATGVDAMLNAGRVKVERFAIDAASVTPETGVNVPGAVLAQNGNRLRLDFGASGLGGLRQAGNGFYRVLLDMDGNGSFADVGDNAFEFHRLFGDANGDAKVDVADTDLVTSQIGRTGSNLDGDLDGNGAVNSTDRLYTTQQRGKKLLDPLLGWLDD
jgi:uncharacterized delta-60 repeat protein